MLPPWGKQPRAGLSPRSRVFWWQQFRCSPPGQTGTYRCRRLFRQHSFSESPHSWPRAASARARLRNPARHVRDAGVLVARSTLMGAARLVARRANGKYRRRKNHRTISQGQHEQERQEPEQTQGSRWPGAFRRTRLFARFPELFPGRAGSRLARSGICPVVRRRYSGCCCHRPRVPGSHRKRYGPIHGPCGRC
jgi:hypothetical protein